MKKFNLVACSLLLTLSLSACSQPVTENTSVSNNSVNEVSTEETVLSPTKEEKSDIVSDNLPEVEIDNGDEKASLECHFTRAKADAVKEYLSQFSLINCIQTMENGVVDDTAKTTITYSVIADTKTDRVDFQTSNSFLYEGQSGTGTTHYFKDYNEDITLERTETEWVEVDGEIQMINWDMSSFENCNDIWDYLARDWRLPVNAIGSVSGDYEYYHLYSDDVDEDFITGIKYDSLERQEITYIYQRYDNGVYVPKSIIAEVIYTIGDESYFVRSTIQLSTVGTTELTMPEYKKG